MQTETTLTKVIYKMIDGEVIALFPERLGTRDAYGTCLSYQHDGQHGAASTTLATLPDAMPAQYAPLHAELIALGYNLVIGQRFTIADRAARVNELRGTHCQPRKG